MGVKEASLKYSININAKLQNAHSGKIIFLLSFLKFLALSRNIDNAHICNVQYAPLQAVVLWA